MGFDLACLLTDAMQWPSLKGQRLLCASHAPSQSPFAALHHQTSHFTVTRCSAVPLLPRCFVIALGDHSVGPAVPHWPLALHAICTLAPSPLLPHPRSPRPALSPRAATPGHQGAVHLCSQPCSTDCCRRPFTTPPPPPSPPVPNCSVIRVADAEQQGDLGPGACAAPGAVPVAHQGALLRPVLGAGRHL